MGVLEKYSHYQFVILKETNGCGQQCDPDEEKHCNTPEHNCYIYIIYTDDIDYIKRLKTNVLQESNEYFDTENEARFAAIGHIDAIESGEPYPS